MRYARLVSLIVVIALATGLAGGFVIWRRSRAAPATLTGPNLLANNDFALDTDGDGVPDGWTTPNVGGVQISNFRFQQGSTGHAMALSGIANYLASPSIVVQPGSRYEIAFRVLADNIDKPSPTQIRVRFHWRDSEGTEFSNQASDWHAVAHRSWTTFAAAAVAPPAATQLSISLHPASDDRIIVDDLHLGQAGVRISPWPDGKRAALALSFDYETAMGGLIHSRSDDPYAGEVALQRAQRMRAGVTQILQLFSPAGIRGTWYTNGYNFLTGNRDRRQFMGNPTFAWATTANRWPNDFWKTTPWFALDPYQDERTAPEWYFGSQIAVLQAAHQDVQSHTFAHFDGGLVTPDDWRADFAAWNDVASAKGVARPSSLAFPWSSSAGMRWDSWEVLQAQGIRSVTRTNWSQPRYRIADRDTFALRTVPGHDTITVVADEYLTPQTAPAVLHAIEAAQLHEGAIDIWAHTEEVTSPTQRDAWAQIIAARGPFWVASVPDIVTWSQAIKHVTIQLRTEAPQYRFDVKNTNSTALDGLTLILPYKPVRVTIGQEPAQSDGDRLIVTVPAHTTLEVTLWPA